MTGIVHTQHSSVALTAKAVVGSLDGGLSTIGIAGRIIDIFGVFTNDWRR